jgi:hypothetical protein
MLTKIYSKKNKHPQHLNAQDIKRIYRNEKDDLIVVFDGPHGVEGWSQIDEEKQTEEQLLDEINKSPYQKIEKILGEISKTLSAIQKTLVVISKKKEIKK